MRSSLNPSPATLSWRIRLPYAFSDVHPVAGEIHFGSVVGLDISGDLLAARARVDVASNVLAATASRTVAPSGRGWSTTCQELVAAPERLVYRTGKWHRDSGRTMRSRRSYNPKRQLLSARDAIEARAFLNGLGLRATYKGNPEHKRNPGDFGLTPSSCPRPDKTLCDGVGIWSRADATQLLRQGFELGLVSKQRRNTWPQNVWMTTNEGEILEAQLENQDTGSYHGYPMPSNDPFREIVVARLKEVHGRE